MKLSTAESYRPCWMLEKAASTWAAAAAVRVMSAP
jgi:hypothetical protein